MELGSWHVINAIIRKQTIASREHADWRKKYPIKTVQERIIIEPLRAMYIGRRTLHEGVTSLEYEEDSFKPYPVFERTNTLSVWVFISDERTDPFFAQPQDVNSPDMLQEIEIGVSTLQRGGKWKQRLPRPDFDLHERIYIIGDDQQYTVDDMQWDGKQWEYYIEGAMSIVTADRLTLKKPDVKELVKISERFLF